MPSKEAIILVGDLTRGSTGVTTDVTTTANLSYTLLGEPATTDPLIDAIESYLDGVGSEAPTVLIDDVSRLFATYESTTVGRVLERVSTIAAEIGGQVAIGCRTRAFIQDDLDPLFRVVDDVYGVPDGVIAAVERLEREDPTTVGYTRRHWREALLGIEQCGRNYPQSKQIHATLDDPQTTTRTLGAALSGLVRLGVLETWGETVGATRYDLTAYDPGAGLCAGITLAAMEASVHVYPRR